MSNPPELVESSEAGPAGGLSGAQCSAPWVGKLHHDREGFADWGCIRDETGAMIMLVYMPFAPWGPEAAEHRRNGTDPTQPRVDAILSSLNTSGQTAGN